MTRHRYSAGERILAVALAFGLLLLLGGSIVPGIVSRHLSDLDEIENLRSRYAQLALRQRDLAALAGQRDDLLATNPEEYGLLVAGTADLARANMQNRLQGFAAAEDATVAQVRALETDAPNRVAAHVSLRMPEAALPGFLARVSEAQPPLFIDTLEVVAGRVRRQTNSVRSELTVEIAVSVFVSLQSPEAAE